MNMTKYEFHKLAEIYPMASKQEFELLITSIKDSGQQNPIILYEDKILDGRNRYIACNKLGVEPLTEVFEGSYEEAMKYSTELNSGRRHTTKSQQAMIAAKVVVESREGGKKKIAVHQAALTFNVSKKYIESAMKIMKESELMATNIFNGNLLLYRAEKSIRELKAEEQRLEQTKVSLENTTTLPEDERYSLEEVEKFQDSIYNKSTEELIFLLNKCLENNAH